MKLFTKKETDLQILRTSLWLPKGKKVRSLKWTYTHDYL